MHPYQPDSISLFDPWFCTEGGKLHCFHLQQAPIGVPCPNNEEGAIGHAVTEDLFHWQRLPSALFRGTEGSFDDGELWTGPLCCKLNLRTVRLERSHCSFRLTHLAMRMSH